MKTKIVTVVVLSCVAIAGGVGAFFVFAMVRGWNLAISNDYAGLLQAWIYALQTLILAVTLGIVALQAAAVVHRRSETETCLPVQYVYAGV